jgi:hypothetical protein
MGHATREILPYSQYTEQRIRGSSRHSPVDLGLGSIMGEGKRRVHETRPLLHGDMDHSSSIFVMSRGKSKRRRSDRVGAANHNQEPCKKLNRFGSCRPYHATSKGSAGEQFHHISIDEFTLLGDVVSFGFRPMTIEMAAIVSGCQPRLK